MYPGTVKEEPNTQNIKAWPEGYKDETEIRRRHHHHSDANDKQKESGDDDENTTLVQKYQWWLEGAEFYAFLGIGSFLWYFLVKSVLDWHRFPYHTYIVEVCFIVIVPIIILAFLLTLLDRRVQ